MRLFKNDLTVPPWEKAKMLSHLLVPFGWAYGAGMEIRNFLYDKGIFKVHRLPIPVISVGNLTVGGTGKTPLTIEIARELRSRNPSLNIGILSRGYARKKTDGWIVSDGRKILMSAEESGDEPNIIARELPDVRVFVGANRVAIAQNAINRFHLDILILDDAFQHRRIHRDVDILLVDGETGLGNGRVLPAGPLREAARNTARATCVVVSRYTGHLPPGFQSLLPPGMPLYKTQTVLSGLWDGIAKKPVPFDVLKDQEVWGICGIARPESFLDALGSLGLKIAGFHPFPDHHTYSFEELQTIAKKSGDTRIIVTTWKDWVKLESIHPFKKIYILSVKTEFLDGENFYTFLEKIVYNRIPKKQGG